MGDERKVEILYICDRKKCENCNSCCNHTSDITHAVNFKEAAILRLEERGLNCMGDERKDDIVYVCDRKKCENCNSHCNHTPDITHAVNFKSLDFGDLEQYWERDDINGNE